ncbi:MAG: hypothetical protein M1819_006310 [Sarea resinae]|nr:MAG: hypothetical protein M1819_006310 [Sarea resinae]
MDEMDLDVLPLVPSHPTAFNPRKRPSSPDPVRPFFSRPHAEAQAYSEPSLPPPSLLLSPSPCSSPSPSPSLISSDDSFPQQRPKDDVKRQRTSRSGFEAIEVIPAATAWEFDIRSLNDSPVAHSIDSGNDVLITSFKDIDSYYHHDTAQRPTYSPGPKPVGGEGRGGGLLILCVIGSLEIHYELLCQAHPRLLALSPSTTMVAISHEPHHDLLVPSPRRPSITNTTTTSRPRIPILHSLPTPPHHQPILQLGLLHPSAGGQRALDAVVVLDRRRRRRLVLPVGWGPGRHLLAGVAGAELVQAQFVSALLDAVEELDSEEREEEDDGMRRS